jgi:hypothetical protein
MRIGVAMSDSHASCISRSKLGRRWLRQRGAVLSGWLLLACKIVNVPPPSDDDLPSSSDSAGNPGERERPGASGGSTSRAGTTSGHTDGAAAAGRAGIAAAGEGSSGSVAAGEGGEAGVSATSVAGAAADGDPPADEDEQASTCDLDGDCLATCHGQLAECGVADPGYSCEFTQLAGVSQQVTCGEPQVAGNVCCGGCGCVDVVLYFDGLRCWQGLPACDLPEYFGKVLFPHAAK